ncbi:MAG: GNAT family N-acetyltransferase [Chitinophagaceae bacterium]
MSTVVLDNPAWEALISVHKGFAHGTENAKRYRHGILPFAGYSKADRGSMEDLNGFTNRGEIFYIIGDYLPLLPADWVIEYELPCAQMLLNTPASIQLHTQDVSVSIEQLGEDDAAEMFNLISTVQPGYYNTDTRLLGTYYGIKEGNKLVAMAGERMRLTGFSELSAICTLAEYTGRGYAQKLITKLCNLHAKTGIISFLHVALSNHRAIRLYEHMGFTQRRTIIFRRIRKQ